MKIEDGNMNKKVFTIDDLTIRPLTPDIWSDFENLFGPKGAYGGCWCMWWRLTRGEFEKGQGEGNRQAMKALVNSGIIPGLVAYRNDEPCGWCSVAPREHFKSLERSRVLKRIDDETVWPRPSTNWPLKADTLSSNWVTSPAACAFRT